MAGVSGFNIDLYNQRMMQLSIEFGVFDFCDDAETQDAAIAHLSHVAYMLSHNLQLAEPGEAIGDACESLRTALMIALRDFIMSRIPVENGERRAT